MPASNIYTYIFEKPFDCTTTATTTTRDLYYYFSHNAAYHRTEIHHPLFFWSAVFRTCNAYQAVTFTQNFLFLYPSEITKSAKHLFVYYDFFYRHCQCH